MSVNSFSLAKLDEMDQLLTRQMGKRILDPRDLSSVLLDVPINAKCDQDLARRMLKCCYGEGGRRHSWRSCVVAGGIKAVGHTFRLSWGSCTKRPALAEVMFRGLAYLSLGSASTCSPLSRELQCWAIG